MDKGRDKSRTPKDERKTKDHSQKEDKANAASKAAAKGAEKKTAGKRLEFTPEHEKKDESVTQPDESKQAAEVAAEKRTRFSESEEESSEARKSNISEESKKTQASKSETPSMALTTLRMQEETADRAGGRFLKAAMECINGHDVEFYPVWNENVVRIKYSYDYLIWLHFSYANATCSVFADESIFDDVQAHFEATFERISASTGRGKGKGKSREHGEGRKGSSKGLYAAMDFAFDARNPYWCKFVLVHDWENNVHVQQALKDEDKAQALMDTSER
ncbi:hypothetical protein AK812_SmicGene18868 [Symbiodinium microadriaticum]|uniref:Uncharacterized protein n=1 Tax=Symbiodinium microadriaticum TaxID=2951 RepID=A0A1Q9DU31_SYMMI|nr:hypothetical protein AK812_SmicGene18868 [Symbiodinium microadriaticum]